ncbi:hypothetical protein PVAND_008086 [Polypedilum vanderplanki]|uniref:Nucleolar protein 9 n=1 Tax=Polypedilum vanderplanki TaxID=319348 RepID=A0A9J6C9G7_POLVA|nr:hypothetical protein PVAND_008086 [Polypedilum vanderplanki]
MGKKSNKKGKTEQISEDPHLTLDADFNQYLREIMKSVENEVNDDEEKSMIVNNFIEAIPEGVEELVARHGIGSKILEKLIGFSSIANFEKFTKCLKSEILFNDSKATYVLETCLKIATVRALSTYNKESTKNEEKEPAKKKSKFIKNSNDIEYNISQDYKVEHKVYCKEFILRVNKFIINNIESLIKSNQGNHLIRTCLLSFAGILNIKSHDKSTNQVNLKNISNASIDTEWIEIVCNLAEKVLEWPHFPELAFNERTSTFLQTLNQTLYNLDQQRTLRKLNKSILKKCFENDKDNEEESEGNVIEKLKPFSCKPATFLLESVMQYCDEKQFNKIYTSYFKSYLLIMCDSNFNFTVQRLIDFTKDKEIFEEIFTQVTSQMSSLLQNGKTGVVLALCMACDRLSFKQGQFIQSILKALECERSQNHIIQCIIALMPLHIIEKKTDIEVNLHGSLILQHILHFNKPIKIVQNLLDMKPQILSDIFCNPKGSRIADAYIDSKFIGEKSREKLIKHMEGMYLKMALSKNGSHVLEKFYQLSSEGQKEIIVKELSERTNQLGSCPSGKIIAHKFHVDVYTRNPNQWRNFLARNRK